MEQIKNTHFEGERPLFAKHDLQLDNVTIHTGESALKECSNIIAINCRFEGKYPFWHTNGFVVKNCLFTEGARAPCGTRRTYKWRIHWLKLRKCFAKWMASSWKMCNFPLP